MGYHLRAVRMCIKISKQTNKSQILKNQKIANTVEDMEKLEHLCTGGENAA